MDKTVELFLTLPETKKRWQKFLISQGINNFISREVAVIDHTVGLIDEDGQLVGTGSIAGNVLKYIAVSNDASVQGARFNQIVSALEEYLFSQKIYHSFVFTKAKYSASFSHLNFKELAHTDEAAFLESGTPNIQDFLAKIPRIEDQNHKKVAAIVMNANPFTLGHQALVKLASSENDLVYVFVVATDASLFKTSERMELVKKGTSEYQNVLVISGGDYLVSQSTFPAYFLKSPDELIATQTEIDALIFKNTIAPKLAIKKRYLGTEPFSRTTNFYNQSLKNTLSPKIDVEIVKRFCNNDQIITATRVRQLIKSDELKDISNLVPPTTFDFINKNYQILQERIKKGMNINGN